MSEETLERLFDQVIAAGRKRNYNKAISLLKKIINNYDYPAKILLYLGRSYHALADYNRAVPVFEFFLKINPGSTAGHFFLGRTYLALEIYKKAVFHLKTVIENTKSPYYFTGLNLIAIAFLKAKKPGLAVSCFEKALELDPQNKKLYTGYLNALLVKAIKLFRNNKLHESAGIFEFLLKNGEDGILPHLYLARIYRLMGNNQKALLHYDIASEMSPDDPSLKLQKAVTLLKLGKRQEAENQLHHIPLQFKKETLRTTSPGQLLRFITMMHFKKEDFRKAIYYAKEILKENYADIDMHIVIAESYLKLGDLEKAKNHYLRCIERDTSRVELYYGLFHILWEKEEYTELMNKVKRVLRMNQYDHIASYFYTLCYSQIGESPEKIFSLLQDQIKEKGPDPFLMNALGEAYLTYDMPELAENWFLRTLKIISNDKKALSLLILLYHRIDKPEKEKEFFENYFHHFPEDHHMKKGYINLLIRLEDFKKAIEEILVVLPLFTKKESLKKKLAHSYVQIKKYKDAILIYKELLRNQPDNFDYLKALTTCLESAGNRTYAITLVEKALSYFKRDKYILFLLGGMYYRDGDAERAIKTFKEVLAVDPGNWVALQNIGRLYEKTGNTLFARKFLKRAKEYKMKK
jgi:tetratricopeptide (TPR) repeat protein